jgi:sugar/nucleoside kinase (ribokinase family)
VLADSLAIGRGAARRASCLDSTVHFEFVAVGEVLIDVVLGELAPGETRHAPLRLRAGGTAVNAALAVAAAGGRAAVVGRVGDDAAGRLIRAELVAAGVEPLLSVDPARPTGTFAEALLGGERAVIADRGATDSLVPADLPAVEARSVLVSGYLLFHDLTHEVARAALHAFGAVLTGATGGSSSLVGRGRLADVDVLVVNDEEAQRLTGLAGEAAAVELALEVDVACVTLGSEGAVAVRGTQVERVGGVEREDTLGAGDAFAALLVDGLADGRGLQQALASAAGSSR